MNELRGTVTALSDDEVTVEFDGFVADLPRTLFIGTPVYGSPVSYDDDTRTARVLPDEGSATDIAELERILARVV